MTFHKMVIAVTAQNLTGLTGFLYLLTFGTMSLVSYSVGMLEDLMEV